MTILWIPHCPPSSGTVRRDEHLIRHLRDKHRIISVTWEAGNDSLIEAIREGSRFYQTTLRDGRTAYHVRRLPDVTRPFRRDPHDAMTLSGRMFKQDIQHIIQREDVDVLITAYSRYMTGCPPFDLDVPIVFDYLDCARWKTDRPSVKPYIENADVVLAVSSLAQEQAMRFNDRVAYLPNGADVNRIRQASGNRILKQYGLENARVLSLVGLIDSPYLVPAVLKAKERIPNLKCLLVGDSTYLREEISKRPGAKDACIYVGPVPYEEVPE